MFVCRGVGAKARQGIIWCLLKEFDFDCPEVKFIAISRRSRAETYRPYTFISMKLKIWHCKA